MAYHYHASDLLSHLLRTLLVSSSVLLSALLGMSHAQIALDGSLGSRGPLAGPNYAIPASVGQIRGANLFHSFDQFNVRTGESATFTGPATIANILSRVTGGSPSSIDGTIRSQIPGANFYVLNPSGVLFGPNARLDISGSFHVSTADALRFADGTRFAARLSETSTLSVAPPVAFGFLRENPAAITLHGSTLHVAEGQTLSVVGGDLTLMGHGPPITEQTVPTLGAPGGRLQLVSVAGPGEVRVRSPAGAADLQLDGVARRGQITLGQGALVTVPREGSPNAAVIEIRAGQLTLRGGSQLDSTTRGAGPGGPLTVEADTLALSEGASLQSRTLGDGAAGAVTIRARAVALDSGGRISSHTFGPGTAGTVTVQAERLRLAGAGASPFAGILSLAEAGSTGDAGAVVVQAEHLVIDGREAPGGTGIGSLPLAGSRGNAADTQVLARDIELRNGGFIRSSTASPGNAGTVTVQAERLVLAGVGQGAIPGLPALRSAIASGVLPEATGVGGNVRVSAGTLEIQPGGIISSATFGPGNAGTIDVQANRLRIDGGDSSVPTGIEATAGSVTLAGRALGAAGRIRVRASDLEIRDGGFIGSNTFGPGAGGAVTVQAERLRLAGAGASPFAGILSLAGAGSTGDAGAVVVQAEHLVIDGREAPGVTGIGSLAFIGSRGNAADTQVFARDIELRNGGFISSSTFGPGNAGTVTVQAERLVLAGVSGSTLRGLPEPAPSTIASAALWAPGFEAPGAAGNVRVSADTLEMHAGGTITSFTSGPKNAGMVDVQANRLRIDGGGAPVLTGIRSTGGTETVPLAGRAFEFGAAGAIRVRAGELEIHAGGAISSATFGPGNAGTVDVQANHLVITGRAAVALPGADAPLPSRIESSAGRGATGAGGAIQITADTLMLAEQGTITARSFSPQGNAGDITLHIARTLEMRRRAVITTEATQADGGNLTVTAQRLVRLQDSAITAEVGGGASTVGGNITIDPQYVLLQQSQIIANANEGQGGNIRIQAQTYLQDPASTVSASSALGINGQVSIQAPVTSLSGAVAPLPQALAQTPELLRSRCVERVREGTVSRFVIGGRDGVPLEPGSLLLSPLPQAGQERVSPGAERARPPTEAQLGRVWYVQAPVPGGLEVECARWRGQSETTVPPKWSR